MAWRVVNNTDNSANNRSQYRGLSSFHGLHITAILRPIPEPPRYDE